MHNLARSRNSASPSFIEIELTMHLPCTHFSPASMTLHLDESIMIGTRAISGSEAIRFRKRTIAASASSMPSSMLMSMICAPASTWRRATASASSYWPLRIRRANIFEPVTLVRSPMLTNKSPAPRLNGSSPEMRSFFSISGIARGGYTCTASRIALMCAGVVPQQPPMTLSMPAAAHGPICTAIASGDSSYSPKALGRPALGCAET
jgi:hypothetical protein